MCSFAPIQWLSKPSTVPSPRPATRTLVPGGMALSCTVQGTKAHDVSWQGTISSSNSQRCEDASWGHTALPRRCAASIASLRQRQHSRQTAHSADSRTNRTGANRVGEPRDEGGDHLLDPSSTHPLLTFTPFALCFSHLSGLFLLHLQRECKVTICILPGHVLSLLLLR